MLFLDVSIGERGTLVGWKNARQADNGPEIIVAPATTAQYEKRIVRSSNLFQGLTMLFLQHNALRGSVVQFSVVR